MNKKRRKILIYWVGTFLILILLLPNIINFKERQAFSDEERLKEAMELYSAAEMPDSVNVVPGEYYKRGDTFTFFLGEKQRELWNTPVQVKVFDYEEAKGGLKPFEMGGSNQTLSVSLKDEEGREWVLRSVDKDQKNALHPIFRPTFLRFMVRDAVAALNPYGHLVVPVLSAAIGIHHKNPELVLVPFDAEYGPYNERMAGRLAYLEEHLNSSWKKEERFGSPQDIVNTEEMMEMQQEKTIDIDTTLYLKTRLFDMLISDWDRHPGQWEWALKERGKGKIFEPIAKDRDNAFYRFDEGILSQLTLLLNNKFQSFRPEYGSISGLMEQSEEQDKALLSSLSIEEFIYSAQQIQQELSDETIQEAFQQYPEPVYEQFGKEHEETLRSRLKKLPVAAKMFYHLVQEK